MKRAASLIAILGIVGCQEYDLVESPDFQADLGEEGEPDIAVDPVQVDFGEVYVDDGQGPTVATDVVTVTNEGTVDLHIQDIRLSDDGGPFSFTSITTVLIPPGGAAQIPVTFEPMTANDTSAVLYIDSDDPDEPTVEVELVGTGIAPVIDVSPMEYDFGSLYIGCDAAQPVTIANIGNADLVVSDFQFTTASTDFSFDSMEDTYGPLPWTLPPGEAVDVEVGYEPMDEYADEAFLFVESNDPYTPQVIPSFSGQGELYGSNVDVYEQPLEGLTDIIFAVDRSCSMYDDIKNVQNNFDVFVTTMASLDADFHVAATVEDDGCINGPDLYIDNSFSASEAQDTITTMINLGGSYGVNTERGFTLLEACLAETGSGGCNEGLIRDEARLNLVGVSDEPEQSASTWSYYVSLFQSMKDNPDDVVIHAIGGDYPSGCGSAMFYSGFYEATVATGGMFLSICATDWGSHLEALAEGSAADLSSFELTQLPVPETIEVRIDGTLTTVGWSYDPGTNAVVFEDDYIPEGGSTIEIEYAIYGDCTQ